MSGKFIVGAALAANLPRRAGQVINFFLRDFCLMFCRPL